MKDTNTPKEIYYKQSKKLDGGYEIGEAKSFKFKGGTRYYHQSILQVLRDELKCVNNDVIVWKETAENIKRENQSLQAKVEKMFTEDQLRTAILNACLCQKLGAVDSEGITAVTNNIVNDLTQTRKEDE